MLHEPTPTALESVSDKPCAQLTIKIAVKKSHHHSAHNNTPQAPAAWCAVEYREADDAWWVTGARLWMPTSATAL